MLTSHHFRGQNPWREYSPTRHHGIIVRQRIMAFLGQGPATAVQITEHLGLRQRSSTSVHLNRLLKVGAIVVTREDLPKLYGLTPFDIDGPKP